MALDFSEAERAEILETWYCVGPDLAGLQLDNLKVVYLAEQRLTDIRAGREATIPLGDLLKGDALDD
jgi:hypothetical protein